MIAAAFATAAFATAAVWAFALVLLVWLAVRWRARQPRIGDRVLVTRGASWSENAEGCTGEIIDIDSQGPRYRVRLDTPIKYRGNGRDLHTVWVHGVARQPRVACKHSTSKLRLDSQRRIVCSCGVLLFDIDTRLIDDGLSVELRGRARDEHELQAKLDSIAHERPRITAGR